MRPLSITGRTRIVCVIGDPIAHSRSPAMHNAAFRHLGLDYAYVAFHVAPQHLRAAVAGFRALQVAGANVTVPHKENIVRLLDSVSSIGRRVGATNTVINRKGKLVGENTDVYGFRRALEGIDVELRGARVIVIGAGGAARAVLVALAESRARQVSLFNQTAARARRLAASFSTRQMPVNASGLEGVSHLDLADVDLVVNTTSLGLNGEKFVPLLYGSAPKHCVFFDLIPKPGTDFVARARRARRPTLDGTSMLLHQGAAAFELWTGQPAPLAVMRRALTT